MCVVKLHRLCPDVMEISLAWGLPEEPMNFPGGLWALYTEIKMVSDLMPHNLFIGEHYCHFPLFTSEHHAGGQLASMRVNFLPNTS